MAVKQILRGMNPKRRLRFCVQRAQSGELSSPAPAARLPVRLFQVIQYANPLFELFQPLAVHCCDLLRDSEYVEASSNPRQGWWVVATCKAPPSASITTNSRHVVSTIAGWWKDQLLACCRG